MRLEQALGSTQSSVYVSWKRPCTGDGDDVLQLEFAIHPESNSRTVIVLSEETAHELELKLSHALRRLEII